MSAGSGSTGSMAVPDVRVGIVSWNTAALLDRCLAALPEALGDLDAEVVVVDNCSADGSAEVADSHGVTVIRNHDNVGYARAMNQALAGSEGFALIALNPDTEAPPGSLAKLVRRLGDEPQAGVVVPRLVDAQGRLQHSVYRFPSVPLAAVVSFVPPRLHRWRSIGRRWWLEGSSPHDQSGPVDWAIGAVHVIRRAALEGRPPYCERWFMYAEDVELCWWLSQRGWCTQLHSEVSVPHIGNASGAQAWGATRERRYWAATYDLYASMRGGTAARVLAGVNVLGVCVHAALNLVGTASRKAGNRRRGQARALASVLRTHLRALVLGPSGLAGEGGVRLDVALPGQPESRAPS